jgi:hypothetical protein
MGSVWFKAHRSLYELPLAFTTLCAQHKDSDMSFVSVLAGPSKVDNTCATINIHMALKTADLVRSSRLLELTSFPLTRSVSNDKGPIRHR